MPAKLPKHSSCLDRRDFTAYLGSSLRRAPAADGAGVWSSHLPERALIPTPTGRHALYYFLENAPLAPGDEVLVAAYNFYIVVRILVQKGLVPVFVDVEPDTLCLDPEDLRRKIGARSRMVLVTHMFGNPANLEAIAAICREHGLLLFEDCAHAVGTRHRGKQVGQAGDGALFSFGVQKLVNSFGGGLLCLEPGLRTGFRQPPHRVSRWHSFSDTLGRFCVSLMMTPSLYGATLHPLERLVARLVDRSSRLRQLIDPARNDGAYRFRRDERAPFKPFMLATHEHQLARLEENVARRRRWAALLKRELAGVEEIGFLDEDRHGRSNFSYFGVVVDDPHRTSRVLAENGIGSSPQEYFDCAALDQFADYAADCPHARQVAAHVLRLPSYPTLEPADARRVARVLRAAVGHS